MKGKIQINPGASVAYIPGHLLKDGFTGECDYQQVGSALVVTKPGATSKQMRESLRLCILELQIQDA